MIIREMSREECLRVLAGAKVARIACAKENQPYVVPVFLVYQGPPGGEACLYGFTTPGQKIEWMRSNPLVCVEIDEVSSSTRWLSVIAFGHYEELHEGDGHSDERSSAHQILQSQAMWWEPASAAHAARVHRDPAAPFVPVFYRVRLSTITGHEATQESGDGAAFAVPVRVQKPCWLRRALRRVFGHK
jgi:nitroimidazol reductase NimA-like FMN-containing flavoprotein (pyridoxamine 5'-phosphate oxidase superfamily)